MHWWFDDGKTTVEPPLKDTPKNHLHKGHFAVSQKPTFLVLIHFNLQERTASLLRTKRLVPNVSFIQRFQCVLNTLLETVSTGFLHAEYQESSDGWVITDRAIGRQLGMERRVREKAAILTSAGNPTSSLMPRHTPWCLADHKLHPTRSCNSSNH